jgi:hypothetical protein
MSLTGNMSCQPSNANSSGSPSKSSSSSTRSCAAIRSGSFLFWEVPRQASYSLSKSLKVTRPQFSDMHRMLEANQAKDLHCGPPVLATEFTTCAWGEMVLPFHVTKTRR